MTTTQIRLTSLAHGGGCGCKLAPSVLQELLRDQPAAGHYSTVEALLFLLGRLGFEAEQAQLRLQFELHVYAGLRARGEKAAAERFLADSPVRAAFPELLAKLNLKQAR